MATATWRAWANERVYEVAVVLVIVKKGVERRSG
jgi:hypothetical protein